MKLIEASEVIQMRGGYNLNQEHIDSRNIEGENGQDLEVEANVTGLGD